MTSLRQVTQFFEDNGMRISSSRDPIAHNTNGGLLALAKFMSTEFDKLERKIDELDRKMRQQEHDIRQLRK